MADELIVPEIEQAAFEYTANFTEPIAAMWFERRHGEVLDALQKALYRWNVGLENISWNQAARNAAEVNFTFAIPILSAAVRVGIGGVTMSAFNTDWSKAPELLALFKAAQSTVRQTVGQELQGARTTLTFHVKPTALPFRDVLGGLVNTKALGIEDAVMYGLAVYSENSSFVIDSSAIFPGGLFIKLIRNFDAGTEFEAIAEALFKDEERVLVRVGLRLQ
jgi:hypothetical protein